MVIYSAGTPARLLLAAALLRHDGGGRFAAFGAAGDPGSAGRGTRSATTSRELLVDAGQDAPLGSPAGQERP